MEKIEKHEGKKSLTAEDYMMDKVLGKIKMITGTQKFDDTKILVETDDKLPDYVTLKNAFNYVRS